MIARLSGRLESCDGDALLLSVGGVAYEVQAPVSTIATLRSSVGREIALHTIQYLEGNPVGANLIPRLIGFATTTEREFFRLFTTVRGISFRKALRAMALPVPQIAGAIARGDARMLTELPEVGRKTAQEIIAALSEHMQPYLAPAEAAPPSTPLSDAQMLAVEILVQWGDRRPDAQRAVAAAVQADPTLNEPDAIVRAAYRAREARGA